MEPATTTVIEIIRPHALGGAQADVFQVRYAPWGSRRAIGIRHKPSGGDRADERARLDRFLTRVEFSHELGRHESGVFPETSRHILRDDGHWCVVEEFDVDLEAHSRNLKLGWSRAAGLLMPALRALRIMHERSLLHRDVKPSNMLIRERERRVVLADLGLLLTKGADPRFTRGSGPVGSLAYLDVAAARGDMARDIYAWFVSWFEVATGELPRYDDDVVAFHDDIRRATPPEIIGPLFKTWRERPLDSQGSVVAIQRITELVLDCFPEVGRCPFARPHLDHLLDNRTRE